MGMFADGTSIFDDAILDKWEVPVGQWVDQSVDWVNNNLSDVLDVIVWPFQFLFDNFVRDILLDVSWVWIVLAFFVVGSLVRGVKVGIMAGAALTLCGFLGSNYWTATMESVGLILVSVFLCALIGIPLGILCGRVNSVWQVVRPVLDAMQVVHPFVFMLPVIFFFGFREVPSTMVTMIFALPPLVRLTNLGVRQVPEDVVEASRSFGAPEIRVLTDVQLPLARPAIMTGLNQTLLLAISMGGIAAIMGANGLGLLIFRAVSNLDVGLAGSAGLAYFIVAVVLDRISQPEETDGGGMFARFRAAWTHRKDPEALLEIPGMARTPSRPRANAGVFSPLASAERVGVLVVGVGSVLAIVSALSTWSVDSGLISGYGRSDDLDLVGRSFNGINAAGGSFYGLFVLAAGVFGLGAAAWSLTLLAQRGSNWLNSAGATVAGGAATIVALSFLLADPSDQAVAYSHGFGVYLAVLGGSLMLVGGWFWAWKAPVAETRPVPTSIAWGRLLGGFVAMAFMAGALYAGWSFDERAETVISPELQIELDRVTAAAESGEMGAAFAAQEIQRLRNTAAAADKVVIDGMSSAGPALAWLPAVLAALGLCTLGLACGMSRSRLSETAERFRSSESESGREGLLSLGLILSIVSLLWVYPVDRLGPLILRTDYRVPVWYRPVGGLGTIFDDWEVQRIGFEWIEASVILIVIGFAVRWAVKAEDISVKATRTLLVSFVGLISFLAVLYWRHGPVPVICVVAGLFVPILVGFLAPTISSRHQWTWATLTSAIGFGMMGLSAAWVFSILRVAARAKIYSGVGAYMAFTAGFILFVSGRGLLGYFSRRKVYDKISDGSHLDDDPSPTVAEAAVLEASGTVTAS